MLSDELVDFLGIHCPVHLSEIGVALDLLIYSLNETANTLTLKGNDLSKYKDYNKAIEFLQKASELDNIAKEMQGYMDMFQLEDVALISEDEILESIEREYPNYKEYEVDNTIVHNLHENFTHKKPYAFELNNKKVYVTEWKNMLVETCNILASIDPILIAKFPENPRFNGRKSKYFTVESPHIMRSPKKLKELELYVETNFSANDIRNLIIKMISYYKIPLSEYKIYLRADYTGLHKKANIKKAFFGKEAINKLSEKKELRKKAVTDFTDSCIKYLNDYFQQSLVKISRAKYTTPDNKIKIVCLTSSERNLGSGVYSYWFGFRVKQKEFLESTHESYVSLGCGSEELILLIPYPEFCQWLDNMSTTGIAEKTGHWHIVVINKRGNILLRLKAGPKINITKYILRGST